MQNRSLRIARAKAGLLIIDLQERLLPAIFEKERVIQNCLRLIKSAEILRVPMFATEQNRNGLGATSAEIVAALGGTPLSEKLAFSACGADGLLPALQAKRVSDVVLCGIEAHVCVCQTSLDLLDGGFRVFVVADAISSRTAENQRLAVDRMRDGGAAIVSTEMVLFELLERAATVEFKRILELLK